MLCYFGWLDLVALRGVFCSVVVWHGECCGFCAFVGLRCCLCFVYCGSGSICLLVLVWCALIGWCWLRVRVLELRCLLDLLVCTAGCVVLCRGFLGCVVLVFGFRFSLGCGNRVNSVVVVCSLYCCDLLCLFMFVGLVYRLGGLLLVFWDFLYCLIVCWLLDCGG